MSEQKKKRKRVRTAPFPLPPEKRVLVRAAREQKGLALPASFIEDERHFVLQIDCQTVPTDYRGPRPSYEWEWRGSTFTVADSLRIIETQIPCQHQFIITAEYCGEPIGKGKYLKLDDRGLEIETISSSDAMIGLLEAAIPIKMQKIEDEREAHRTVTCDYPGCCDQILASLGPVRQFLIQVDGQTHTLTFYGCEGAHREALIQASSLSIALTMHAPNERGYQSSHEHLLELTFQQHEEREGVDL